MCMSSTGTNNIEKKECFKILFFITTKCITAVNGEHVEQHEDTFSVNMYTVCLKHWLYDQ